MKAVSQLICTITVNSVEARRIAAILDEATTGAVRHDPLPRHTPHPLRDLWQWCSGEAVALRNGAVGSRTLGEEEARDMKAAIATYMKDRKVAALDDVDVAIVRALLFGDPS